MRSPRPQPSTLPTRACFGPIGTESGWTPPSSTSGSGSAASETEAIQAAVSMKDLKRRSPHTWRDFLTKPAKKSNGTRSVRRLSLCLAKTLTLSFWTILLYKFSPVVFTTKTCQLHKLTGLFFEGWNDPGSYLPNKTLIPTPTSKPCIRSLMIPGRAVGNQ